MTTERPAPRDLAKVPSSFSKGDPQWREDPSASPLVAAAALQAAVAHRIEAWTAVLDLSRRQLARKSGLSADRIGRILRGEQWMDLADAVALGRALDTDLIAVQELRPRGVGSPWIKDSDVSGPGA